MSEQNLIDKEQAEIILAEVIDDLYLAMKKNFCGGKPHKLGYFKELIKANFHKKLKEKI
jgi:hypothetical protein